MDRSVDASSASPFEIVVSKYVPEGTAILIPAGERQRFLRELASYMETHELQIESSRSNDDARICMRITFVTRVRTATQRQPSATQSANEQRDR